MKSLSQKLFKAHQECPKCPSPKMIHTFFEDLLGMLFPEYAVKILETEKEVADQLANLQSRLSEILIQNQHLFKGDGKLLTESFFHKLGEVYDLIHLDVDAMYEGDPAAKSRAEILRCYPGFYAIAAYRIGHLLHTLGVSMIPRIITEFAHSKTGIEIHPAAKIGHYFCIDHGTGVVIGETTIIGNNVKIYQGVTLGALSVRKEDADKKRHPTIEDNVIIYAGATILGGETVVGEGSVIGSQEVSQPKVNYIIRLKCTTSEMIPLKGTF
jgi:serine O-acetyltransferase